MSREKWTDLFGEVHNQCNCRLCLYSRKVRGILHRRNADEMKDTINDLMDANYNIGADLEYAEAILDGSWPSSVEQLDRALEKAKNHPNRVLEQKENRRWSKDKV